MKIRKHMLLQSLALCLQSGKTASLSAIAYTKPTLKHTFVRGIHRSTIDRMPRGVKKENLPSKVCVVCQRPFTWRKKWEKVWDEVTTCSKSCNRKRRQQNRENNSRQHFSTSSADIVEDEYDNTILKFDYSNDMHNTDKVTEPAEVRSIADAVDEADFSVFDEVTDTLEKLAVDGKDQMTPEVIKDDLDDCHSNSSSQSMEDDVDLDPAALRKKARKEAKKRKKQERRAQREGRGDKSAGQKQCDICGSSVDLLIRCTIDESAEWKMVCGKCWPSVSGGVVDGDSSHPHYRYGGLWKNRRKR